MGERTSHAPGTFSWVDLGTPDADSAKRFYSELFGWELTDEPTGPGNTYTVARVDGSAVCALYKRRADLGTPAWLSYITVESAEETALRAGELGGSIIQPSFDVMDAGRMALLSDPNGAMFGIWQPNLGIGAELVNDPGTLCLNQLNTDNPEAAQTFYKELFGWTVEYNGTDTGDYWGLYNDGTLNGGLMPLPPEADAPPHWLVYFTVSDLDRSVAQIAKELDGQIFGQPMKIESGRIAVAADQQGAVFAMFEGEVDP